MNTSELAERVAALFDSTTIDAVVRDGWPRPMVEAGFALHRRTWDIDAMFTALEVELGELDAVPSPPASMTHVWPALPGAGVSPMLWAALLGVPNQKIRSSHRTEHFARRFADVFDLELTTSLDAERVVVSGSDETIAHICEQVGEDRVAGYGDRRSFAVADRDTDVHALATDVVMWFGRGCFSAQAVLFVGPGLEDFAARLAGAIARREQELAPNIDETLFAQRAQAIGVAQFETRVWPARLGWVELRERWTMRAMSPDVVAICACETPAEVIDVPARHRQGVAWGLPGEAPDLGVTRVCAPGELQAPEPGWRHDGVVNAAALLGLSSGRMG